MFEVQKREQLISLVRERDGKRALRRCVLQGGRVMTQKAAAEVPGEEGEWPCRGQAAWEECREVQFEEEQEPV